MDFITGVIRVIAPSNGWTVFYVNNDKVWEGHNCPIEPTCSIIKALGGTFTQCEFTDEDAIDGNAPDKFSNIKSLKFL